MIRNIKKIINNRLSEFKFSSLGNNYFKNNLLSNLNKIKNRLSKPSIEKKIDKLKEELKRIFQYLRIVDHNTEVTTTGWNKTSDTKANCS